MKEGEYTTTSDDLLLDSLRRRMAAMHTSGSTPSTRWGPSM